MSRVRGFFGSLAGDITIISLIISQVALVTLAYFGILSPFFSAPIIVGIAIIASYFRRGRQSQQQAIETLKQLQGLLEEFASVALKPRNNASDFRIVKVLDSLSFPAEMPDETAGSIAGEIAKMNDVFLQWYETLMDGLSTMMSVKTGNLRETDWCSIVDHIVAFYNGYVEKVAEQVIRLAGKSNSSKDPAVRETYLVFRENLSLLRGRFNTFLKSFQEKDHKIKSGEVRVLKVELQ
jgi:hypothetical protein